MKIIATNIGNKRTVEWNGREITTGIFKYPVDAPIVLGKEDVEKDMVYDRRYHGGVDKACYAYSADFYDHWKSVFPELDWSFGMFGENLTIEGLDEHHISIGDIYKVGDARIQVAQPRQPCLKLNVRFSSNKMVKLFTQYGRSGIYFRVLTAGAVQVGDVLELEQKGAPELSVYDVFQLMYTQQESALRTTALTHPHLAESAKLSL